VPATGIKCLIHRTNQAVRKKFGERGVELHIICYTIDNMKHNSPKGEIAYLSMEIAIDEKLSTYAGGLGVLAGDFLRSAADLNLPLVGVSLLNRHGYFKQKIDQWGQQSESPESNNLERLKKIQTTIRVAIGTNQILVGLGNIWLIGDCQYIFWIPISPKTKKNIAT